MALMIHTKLPYAVMRKISRYNQLCGSRFCTCFMYVFFMPYMDIHSTQRCVCVLCMHVFGGIGFLLIHDRLILIQDEDASSHFTVPYQGFLKLW